MYLRNVGKVYQITWRHILVAVTDVTATNHTWNTTVPSMLKEPITVAVGSNA
jgi:hypothetical protein